MPPRNSTKQKPATQPTYALAFAASVTKLCDDIENGKAQNDVNITSDSIQAVRKGAKSFRSKGKYVPGVVVEQLLVCVDVEENRICRRLDPALLAAIVDIMLNAEISRSAERVLFLVAKSVFHDPIGTAVDVAEREWEIGKAILNDSLAYLLDTNNDLRMRRWVGLICVQLLERCFNNLRDLESGSEDLRRSIGASIINEKKELIRVILGQLVRNLADWGLPLDDYFPNGTDQRLYNNFPVCSQGDTAWGRLFDEYLDRVMELSGQESPDEEDIYFGILLSITPDIPFGAQDRNFYMSTDKAQLIFMAQKSEDNMNTFLDVPLEAIVQLSIFSNSKNDGVWVVMNVDIVEGISCYLDTVSMDVQQLQFRSQKEHSELLKSRLGALCPRISVDEKENDAMFAGESQLAEGNLTGETMNLSQSNESFVLKPANGVSPYVRLSDKELEHGSRVLSPETPVGTPQFATGPRRDGIRVATFGLSISRENSARVPSKFTQALLRTKGVEGRNEMPHSPVITKSTVGNDSDEEILNSCPAKRRYQLSATKSLESGILEEDEEVYMVVDTKQAPKKKGTKKTIPRPKAKHPIPMPTLQSAQGGPTSTKFRSQEVTKLGLGKAVQQSRVSKIPAAKNGPKRYGLKSLSAAATKAAAAALSTHLQSRDEIRDIFDFPESSLSSTAIQSQLDVIGSSVLSKEGSKKYSSHVPDLYDIPDDDVESDQGKSNKKVKQKTRKSTGTITTKPIVRHGDAKKKRQSAPAKLHPTLPTRQSRRGAAARATAKLRGIDDSSDEEGDQILPAKKPKSLSAPEQESQHPVTSSINESAKLVAMMETENNTESSHIENSKGSTATYSKKGKGQKSGKVTKLLKSKVMKSEEYVHDSSDGDEVAAILQDSRSSSTTVKKRTNLTGAESVVQPELIADSLPAESGRVAASSKISPSKTSMESLEGVLSQKSALSMSADRPRQSENTEYITKLGNAGGHDNIETNDIHMQTENIANFAFEHENSGTAGKKEVELVSAITSTAEVVKENDQRMQESSGSKSKVTSFADSLAHALRFDIDEDREFEGIIHASEIEGPRNSATQSHELSDIDHSTHTSVMTESRKDVSMLMPVVAQELKPSSHPLVIGGKLPTMVSDIAQDRKRKQVDDAKQVPSKRRSLDKHENDSKAIPFAEHCSMEDETQAAPQPDDQKSSRMGGVSSHQLKTVTDSSLEGRTLEQRSDGTYITAVTDQTAALMSEQKRHPSCVNKDKSKPTQQPLVIEHQIRKQKIISFNEHGPRNQGVTTARASNRNLHFTESELPVRKKDTSDLTQLNVKMALDEVASKQHTLIEPFQIDEQNAPSGDNDDDEPAHVPDSTPLQYKAPPAEHERGENMMSSPPHPSQDRSRSQRQSSQVSRVDSNGSPLPVSDIPAMDHFGKLAERLSDEVQSAILETANSRCPTGSPTLVSNMSLPAIKLKKLPKARPELPSVSRNLLIAHESIKIGQYEGIETAEIIEEQRELADPFSAKARRTTHFTQRLESERMEPKLVKKMRSVETCNTEESTDIAKSLTLKQLRQGSANDDCNSDSTEIMERPTRRPTKHFSNLMKDRYEITPIHERHQPAVKTLMTAKNESIIIKSPPRKRQVAVPDEHNFEGQNVGTNLTRNTPDGRFLARNRENHRVKHKRVYNISSPDDMTDQSTSKSSQRPDTPSDGSTEQIKWNMAIRPHYTTLHSAAHRIADEVLMRLSKEEDALRLLAKDYEEKAQNVMENFEETREKRTTHIRKQIEQHSSNVTKLYRNAGAFITEQLEEVSLNSVERFELEWKANQDRIRNNIMAGREGRN